MVETGSGGGGGSFCGCVRVHRHCPGRQQNALDFIILNNKHPAPHFVAHPRYPGVAEIFTERPGNGLPDLVSLVCAIDIFAIFSTFKTDQVPSSQIPEPALDLVHPFAITVFSQEGLRIGM